MSVLIPGTVGSLRSLWSLETNDPKEMSAATKGVKRVNPVAYNAMVRYSLGTEVIRKYNQGKQSGSDLKRFVKYRIGP